MTRKLILGIVVMLSLTMVSCGNKQKNVTTTQDTTSSSSTSQENNNSNNTDSTSSEDTTKDENKTTENQATENQANGNTTSSNNSSQNTDDTVKFSIYTVDENSLEPNEVESISISENESLNDKLKQLAKSVSDNNFNGLPIEIESIDTVNGKKIATINLVDSGNNTWVQKFQGSTGGQVTANTLIENFLQSNNNNANTDWIDGVKFLYNNEPIEYDHVSDLSEVQYRN